MWSLGYPLVPSATLWWTTRPALQCMTARFGRVKREAYPCAYNPRILPHSESGHSKVICQIRWDPATATSP
ncbi:hypothetical protein FIBSPDRAFT_878943 [Athelia psychrophila]|uniref:Uncharacterized protein n=1 Tax=Athelia psychrophila TaxID=1759441 RepID=A0A167UJV0_9AGAM|nr:hypothetical protein FIBSPDRAFT_878943 [Fibularhizoctonia sp. CBS 109695]